MTGKENILSQQNPILKVIASLILVLISSIISIEKFFIIFAFTLIYMIISPNIYIRWLKTIIKIIPFFISIFVFGILFQIYFPVQCFLSLRIIHLLLISVYLSETSSIYSIINGNKNQDSGFWFKCKFLIIAIVHFIPILTVKFNDKRRKHKSIIDIIVLSMEDSFKEIHNVEKAVFDKVVINKKAVKVSIWSDIYLSLLAIVPGILMFIHIN